MKFLDRIEESRWLKAFLSYGFLGDGPLGDCL